MKIADIKKLIDVEGFFKDIEATKQQFNCSYSDAIIHCCEAQNIEVDVAATIIRSSPTMKKKLYECSRDLRMIG